MGAEMAKLDKKVPASVVDSLRLFLNPIIDGLSKETKAKVKYKKCLQCGRGHYHNNDFCSRDCCLQYKVAHRGK